MCEETKHMVVVRYNILNDGPTLALSLITSETFPSCARRGSIEPVSAQRAAMASDDFPLPLLSEPTS